MLSGTAYFCVSQMRQANFYFNPLEMTFWGWFSNGAGQGWQSLVSCSSLQTSLAPTAVLMPQTTSRVLSGDEFHLQWCLLSSSNAAPWESRDLLPPSRECLVHGASQAYRLSTCVLPPASLKLLLLLP